MKKQILCILISLNFIISGYSANLSDFVSKENAVLLEKDQKVIRVSTGNIHTQLVPALGLLKQLVDDIKVMLEPTIAVENLYLYKKPPAKIGTAWTEREQLGLFNEIRAISTLSGIEYYSASRNKMRTFYEASHVIDNPVTKNPIPDPIDHILPEETSLFARQKDLTFGDNVYRYEYKTSAHSIIFLQTNLSTLSYGIVPLIKKENLKSLISIIDIDEGLLLYAVTFAKASTIPGIEGKIKDSFSNRTEAVYKWFISKVHAVFK